MRPNHTEIAAAVMRHGSIVKAAEALGYHERTVRRWLKERPADEPGSLTVNGDEAVLVEPPSPRPKLGDVGKLIRERGLDPEEWVVVSTTLNEWDAAIAGGTQRMKQWKVTLRRAPHLVLALPASHVPPVKRWPRIMPLKAREPEVIVVEGDHQVPYHDPKLHEASLAFLSHLYAHHNLTEHVFLGDTLDLPTISKHADHPAAMAPVNKCIQGGYDLLRAKRDVAPNARARKLKGNHDWRLESELLLRAERMYGIKPASVDGAEELPALSLRRLLHLDALGIELVEDPRGWQHAEVELVPGMFGLVVRHGWLTGENTAARSLRKRGRSMIVGHTHTRESFYAWDPSAGVERQAAVAGTMSLVRGGFEGSEDFPNFAPEDNWLPGLVTVTRFPDGAFNIEHAIWNGSTLLWRDRRF